MGLYPLYPASADELSGLAGELLASAGKIRSVIGDVQDQVGVAGAHTGGDLRPPVDSAGKPVIAFGTDTEQGVRFAAGALIFFAQAITTYDHTINQINAEYDLAPPASVTARMPDWQTRKTAADTKIEQAGGEVAGMLGRGPNAADIAALKGAGAYPMPDQAAPLGMCFVSAQAARDWWASLSPLQKAEVIAQSPSFVGSTDGFPADARDDANRILLNNDIDRLQTKQQSGVALTDDEQHVLDNALAVKTQLDNTEARTDPITGEPVTAQLLIYEPGAFGGDGRGAISVGDAQTADNVAFLVPGMGTELTSVGTYVPRASNIYDESRWAAPGESTAVIAWIGYDAPSGSLGSSVLQVVGKDQAIDGAEYLARDVAGFNGSRFDDPHVTVVGHSYGSTTAARSADDNGLATDDLLLVGSPGAGNADDANDLTTGRDHTWVGAASRDIVSMLGNHGWVNAGSLAQGNDPAEDDFHANRFEAESTDRTSWHRGVADHGRYFDPDSESLYDISSIVVGNYDQVHRPDDRYDPWWESPQDPEWDRTPAHLTHQS